MDSHTNRIVSTSGLFHSDHMLPPVRNIGVMYLDDPLTEKEIVLHNAKKALKDLEDSMKQGVGAIESMALQTKLSKALFALREEKEYFFERYIKTGILSKTKPPESTLPMTEKSVEAADQKFEEAQKRKLEVDREVKEARSKNGKIVLRDGLAAYQLEQNAKKQPNEVRQKFLQERRQAEQKEAIKRSSVTANIIKAYEEAAEAEVEAARQAREKADISYEKEDAATDAGREAWYAEDFAQEKEEAYYTADRADILTAQKATDAAAARANAEKEEKDAEAALQEATKAAAEAQAAENARAKAAEAVANAKVKNDWYFNEGWLKTWMVVNVSGDGDCLPRALCHFHDKGNDNCHTDLRRKIVSYMRSNKDQIVLHGLSFQSVIETGLGAKPAEEVKIKGGGLVTPRDADHYLDLMSQPGTYCTELELVAYKKLALANVHVVIRDLPRQQERFGVVVNPPPFEPLVGDDTFYIYYDAASEHYMAMERRR